MKCRLVLTTWFMCDPVVAVEALANRASFGMDETERAAWINSLSASSYGSCNF
jgi:hypothetical protein